MSTEQTPVHRFEAAGLGKAPFRCTGFQKLIYQACPGAPVQPGGSCDFCGTGIMNAFQITSSDSKTFKVGCDCVAKVGDAGLLRQVKRAQSDHRKVASAERWASKHAAERKTREEAARARRKQCRADANTFAQAHGLVPALRYALKTSKRTLAKDFLQKLRAFGSLTPAQVKFALAIGTRTSPAPTGKVTFTGTIEQVKSRDGYAYGSVDYKMIVRADDGFRAWMTAPRSLLDTPGQGLERFNGLRVCVTATLQPSKDDPGFAFGKRPKVTLEQKQP